MDNGMAFRKASGHDGIFSSGNGGFIEEDIGCLEGFREGEEVSIMMDLDGDAEGFECEEVSIDASSSDFISTGFWEFKGPEPEKQRDNKSEGASQLFNELIIDL